MKRILFGGSLLILLIGVTSLAPAKKHKYTSSEAKLSVTFPSEFKTDIVNKVDYRSVKTQAISEEMVFLVIFSEHGSDMGDTEELAEVSLGAFLEGVEATSKNKTSWKVNNSSGLKSTFEAPEKDLIGEYRVVLIGQIQYQITAVSSKEAWDEKKAKKFFKSFKIKK